MQIFVSADQSLFMSKISGIFYHLGFLRYSWSVFQNLQCTGAPTRLSSSKKAHVLWSGSMEHLKKSCSPNNFSLVSLVDMNSIQVLFGLSGLYCAWGQCLVPRSIFGLFISSMGGIHKKLSIVVTFSFFLFPKICSTIFQGFSS